MQLPPSYVMYRIILQNTDEEREKEREKEAQHIEEVQWWQWKQERREGRNREQAFGVNCKAQSEEQIKECAR